VVVAAANRLQGSLARRLAEELADGTTAFGDWTPLLRRWAASAPGRATLAALDARVAAGAVVYPADPFSALRLTPRADVRVLVLGQDPYHGPGQAEGLAFSVPPGCAVPPSLRNIHAELQRDLGITAPGHGSLRAWAAQGVLLLNTALTVEGGLPASHAKIGWHVLTSAICTDLYQQDQPMVVMLWGAHAQRHWDQACAGPAGMEATHRPDRHTVLRCNHPSPLAARRPPVPFIGCGHFGLASRALQAAGRGAVDWRLQPPA
jgi:uracil-DNA glycosylase